MSFLYKEHFSARGEEPVNFCLQTSDMAGLARLAASDTAVALENMPILVELGDIGNSKQLTVCSTILLPNKDI